jgi:hypothetical protein
VIAPYANDGGVQVSRKLDKVSLEELANDRLPKRIVDAISEMPLSIEEMVKYNQAQPPVHLSINGNKVRMVVNVEISLSTFLTTVGTVASTTWIIFQLVMTYML